MSLNPSAASASMKSVVAQEQVKFVNNQQRLTPKQLSEGYDTELDHIDGYSDIYHTYAKGGALLGADLSVGGTLSLLYDGFLPTRDSNILNRLATSVASYWTSNNTKGEPFDGGVKVISVTIPVDASAIQTALEDLNTNPPKGDRYLALYQAIQDVVTSTPCTIVQQLSDGTTAPFIEYIT